MPFENLCLDTKTLTPMTLTFTSDLLPIGELRCLLATLVFFTPSSSGYFWSVSLIMLYFIFVVNHIHLHWFATKCRTWFRPSLKPRRGTWCLLVNARILANRVTSHCMLVTIFFQACKASRRIFSTLCRRETLKCVSQRIRRERGLNLGPSNPQSK